MAWSSPTGWNTAAWSRAAVAGATGSVWGDHGSQATLSTTTIANDTVTGNASDWGSARGTVGYDTGKHYCEIKCLQTTNGNFIVGLIDDQTAIGSMNDFNIQNSNGSYMFNGTSKNDGAGMGGNDIGAGWTLAVNDTLAIAWDATNGYHYLAKNSGSGNVWFLSGDPTSGATATGRIGQYINIPLQIMRPWVVVFGPSANGVFQLITTPPFAGSIPSGYSAWG